MKFILGSRCVKRWTDITNTRMHRTHVCDLDPFHANGYHICVCGARLRKE